MNLNELAKEFCCEFSGSLPWSMERVAGLIKVSCLSSDRKVTNRIMFRRTASMKAKVLYINFCPMCGEKQNKDLYE